MNYRPTQAELDELNAEETARGQEPYSLDEFEASRILREWEEGRLSEEQAFGAASSDGAREELRLSIGAMKALREVYPLRVKKSTIDKIMADIQAVRAKKEAAR